MKTCFTAAILLICCLTGLSAQNTYRITGRVIDKENKAIEFASVVVSDNSNGKMTGTASDSTGWFSLALAEGEYTLEISMIGYVKHVLKLNADTNIALEDITLQDDVNMLKEVKVTANRVDYNMSGYEYNVGKVEALRKMDLTDVLKTAPGLMVSNRITLYGSPVVNVYVDRRRVRMDDHSLLTYLNTFKGENIEKIEVISDPDISERYSGTAIRITTKKQEGGLASASVRANGSESKYVVNPNFNLNYRRGKFSLYTSGSYMNMHNNSEEVVISDWKSEDKSTSEKTTEKLKLPLSVNGTFGIGYNISKNDYLSAEISHREIHRNTDRETVIENSAAGGSTSESRYTGFKNVTRRPAASLMYVHKFQDASELTVTGDYVGSYNSNDYITDTRTVTENNTSTFAGYARYTRNFNKKHRMNTGLQYSYISNEALNNSSSFTYDESEFRPFASYSFNGTKIGFSAGVRGFLAEIDSKSYYDITPNASVSYFMNRSKGHILRANYSMDVIRPTISSLNPDAVLSDNDIFVRIGNPDLKSYYRNNYELVLTMFNRYRLSAGYYKADNAITPYMYTDNEGTIYQSYMNNATDLGANVSFNTNLYLFNRLSMNFNAAYYFSENTIDGKSSINNSFSYSLMSSLMLPKGFSADLTAIGNTKKVLGYNATRKEPLYLDLSVTKRIKRWRLKFEVNDILNSNKGRDITIDMGDYTQTISNRTSSRSYQFTVSYNFNWGKAGATRKAQTMKNEINSRIGD